MVVERGHRVAAEKPGAALRSRRDSFVAGTDVHRLGLMPPARERPVLPAAADRAPTGELANGRSRRCGARTGVPASRRRPGCSPYVPATDRPVKPESAGSGSIPGKARGFPADTR